MKERRIIFEIKGSWATAKPLYVEAITAGFMTFIVRDAVDAKHLRELGKVEVISPLIEIDPDYLLLEAIPS
ncbi:MAG: hypothetical protein GYA24_21405, partial [Candidatus Lokiarchaeota archaeon]|nr:hypothetical protein [Candidatus Lokiarchaeota archaeon]